MNKYSHVLALSLAIFPILAKAQARIEDPWARPTVAGQTAAGGFLQIIGGAQPDRLLEAKAAIASSTELHTMVMDGNIMRMRSVANMDVPAGTTVSLAPGGLHLMFQGLKAPLKAGQEIELNLRFEKAGWVKVPMRVKAQHGMPGHDHQRDHGHGH